MNSNANTKRLVTLGILAAIVIILQFAVSIPLGPFTVTLTLVPIIIGAILYGPAGGAVLGAIFGIVVSIQVLTGAAGAFSTMMLEQTAIGTLGICILKGLLAGLVAGLLFKAISQKSYYGGVMAAAIAAPIVNTGIFSIACLTLFKGLVVGALGTEAGLLVAFLTAFIGVNFLVEFLVNVLLVPIIVRILKAVNKNA